MSEEFEEYVKEEIRNNFEKRYLAYLEANSCPKCKIPMGLIDDGDLMFCILCGHTGIFTEPKED